ncbi:LysR family transcriptional regulator [Pseudomonas sp. NPDC089554]|uniref:LysR family transcriptional regulator n=1 Tax=Pseudomonas sp. NPDC089554 TaxID=3390653 RepID=UPI003CFE3452
MPMLEIAGYPSVEGRKQGGQVLDLERVHDRQALACFLAAARCGCFMQAARSLNLAAPVLRKKLSRLETILGTVLFVSSDHGVALSHEGMRLQRLLQGREAHQLTESVSGAATPRLRVAVCEPLLHDILGRNLMAFIRQHARVRLELVSIADRKTDLQLRLADDAMQCPALAFACDTPECLAVLGYQPYIAKRYCREINRPTSHEALQDYMLVQWAGDAQVPALAPWHRLLAARDTGLTELAGYELFLQTIRCSASIGLLPLYAEQLDRSLMALPGLLDVPMERGVWLAVNTRSAQLPLVQALMVAIRSAFIERRDWL